MIPHWGLIERPDKDAYFLGVGSLFLFMLLSVEHLRKHFGSDGPVLADVTFQVFPGNKIGLVGPNGCGKTTL